MQAPRTVAKNLLALVICSTMFADYWEYSRQYHGNPDHWWTDVISGTADAPQQYRILVPRLGNFMQRHGHMGLRHAFTLIDLLSAFLAVYLLYSLFERSGAYRAASETARWFGAAAFVALVQYALLWILWYQKPETMASAALLAVAVWLITVPLPMAKGPAMAAGVIGILAAAALESLARPDVMFSLQLGVLLVCLTRYGNGFALPRAVQAATSAAAVLLVLGIQYYLAHVAFPHAAYGKTPVFQLVLNLTHPGEWVPFFLFMAPWAWMMGQVARRRVLLDAPSIALVTASVLFMGLWFLAGRVEEVRIFMAYALALIPLTCGCAMERFVGADKDAAAIQA